MVSTSSRSRGGDRRSCEAEEHHEPSQRRSPTTPEEDRAEHDRSRSRLRRHHHRGDRRSGRHESSAHEEGSRLLRDVPRSLGRRSDRGSRLRGGHRACRSHDPVTSQWMSNKKSETAQRADTYVGVAVATVPTTTGRAVVYNMRQLVTQCDGTLGIQTTLGRSKVFAGSRSARLGTTSLLDAQGAAFVLLALQTILGCIGLFRRCHLDEAKATALASVWVTHDVALLDHTVLFKKTRDLLLGETRVDAGHEEIRSGVGGLLVIVLLVAVAGRGKTGLLSVERLGG